MDEGETEGDVVTADYDKFEVPETDEPLRFNGDVSVVVGEITYSSAIVFANTIQDFEFGQVVGEKSGRLFLANWRYTVLHFSKLRI